MRLSSLEREICKEFSKRRADGKVRCSLCPLVINKRDLVCKKNISKVDAKKYYGYQD